MSARITPLVASLPSTVPFVGPETQERRRGRPFRARIGANENGFGPSPKAVAAMAEAAGACRWAEVTIAVREALTVAGRCLAGDVLALVEGEVNLIGKDLRDTAVRLLDRMLAGGGELVTLILGADAGPDLADALSGHLSRSWPFVTTQVYQGDQPHYPLLVGVE